MFDNGNLYVTDTTDNRVEEINTKGEYVAQFGSYGAGNGQFSSPSYIATNPATGNLYVVDEGNHRVQEFTPSGAFLTTFGSQGSGNGQLGSTEDFSPDGIAVSSTGTAYVVDTANSRVEEWIAPRPGNEGAHDGQTIYYSVAANAEYSECGGHPEWAGLACMIKPTAQPGVSGLPELPVKKYTYNMWNEPETMTETVGSTTRTKKATYDSVGRLEKSTISSTVGTALPTVKDEYNEKTGALEKQSTEGTGQTVTSKYNSLGQLESYTDADGNVSTYEYDVDGRIHKSSDGKGSQTFTYDAVTGDPTQLVDSAAGTFTATYDVENNMLTEGYPNGMNAKYTYNALGSVIALEYKKITHCTENCTWFSDAAVPSIHGQWLEQTSTLSKQVYTYDNAARLTQVQNTPVGKGCTTHSYTYDQDTNRTSLITNGPNGKGECSNEGSALEQHAYDEADRLTDTGVSYSEFGDMTTVPSADAGGSELISTYYSDNQTASQTQNGQTLGYNLDPAGRTRETVATGKKVADVINHFAGPGSSPAWTTNTSGETTRNISGIGGQLVAIQNGTEAPVLQLGNLHGDIIATAYLSETATALASTGDTSEFGVPTTSLPPKYSWLGALELPTELSSGVIAMGARSYVPQLGRFLQPDPIPGGSANAYSYTFGDPVNSDDPTGEYTASAENWVYESSGAIASAAAEVRAAEIAAALAAIKAAEEAAARIEAERAAELAAWDAHLAGPSWGGEEEWEEWEEGEEYEYASYHHGSESDSEEGHIEDVVLIQPLQGEEGEGAGGGEGSTSSAGSRLMILGGCPNVNDPCYPKKPTGHRHRARAKQQNPEARACTASEECGHRHTCLPTCGNTPEQKVAREAVEFLTPVVKEVGETVVQHFTPADG